MKLTILGAGTFVPELKRSCSSYLIEYDKYRIIFDFGMGTIYNLLRLKKDLYDFNKIFITHTHADHLSEIVSFLAFILYAPEKDKLKIPYEIYGPKGIRESLRKIKEAFQFKDEKFSNRIKIHELSGKEIIKMGKLEIKPFEVNHSKRRLCLGYQILEDKKKICYSGDSGYCKSLKCACQDADIAIIEATLPKKWDVASHMNGEETGKIAREARVKKLILTHVANTYLSQVKKDVKKEYNGKIIIAKDLMKIKIV
jgi:ribonuclease BN (tRNA processing enzyme)